MRGGRVITTQGVSSLGSEGMSDVVQMVRLFSDFSEDNDPNGEHDFGSFEYHGSTYIWKITYYDTTYSGLSVDPSVPSITHRVLTIMHSTEY